MNGTVFTTGLTTGRLARAELRKLFTTKALPVSFAVAIALAIGSVLIDATVAGQHGTPRLGTDASTYQMLKFGAVTCVVMLILGVLAAGGEFRHRTIVPVLLATPHRARVFAVKVAVIAVLGALFGALVFGLGEITIVAAIAWTLFVEQVILAAVVPHIEKWLPTAAAIGLTNAPGPDPSRALSPVTAGLVLTGYAIALLVAASRTTMRRDVA